MWIENGLRFIDYLEETGTKKYKKNPESAGRFDHIEWQWQRRNRRIREQNCVGFALRRHLSWINVVHSKRAHNSRANELTTTPHTQNTHSLSSATNRRTIVQILNMLPNKYTEIDELNWYCNYIHHVVVTVFIHYSNVHEWRALQWNWPNWMSEKKRSVRLCTERESSYVVMSVLVAARWKKIWKIIIMKTSRHRHTFAHSSHTYEWSSSSSLAIRRYVHHRLSN